MREIVSSDLCSGCSACFSICASSAIDMQLDARGFLVPVIDKAKCVDCLECKRVCPSIGFCSHNSAEADCYVCVHKDKDMVLNSSSGGAFSAIVQAHDDGNSVFFGAGLNGLRVEHSFVDNASDAARFRKSKYAQSDVGRTYSLARAQLFAGKRVFYSGTPCQIAGLLAYLGEPSENLITIDLICTGIMSPQFFRDCFLLVEEKSGKKIYNVDMRSKYKKSEAWVVINTAVEFMDRSTVSDKLTNAFKNCFGQRLGYREICYQCPYACLPRVADLTLGDWWGGKDSLPNQMEDCGMSLVLANSEKGRMVVSDLHKTMHIASANIAKACQQNPTLSRPTIKPKRNKDFWRDYGATSTEKLLRIYSRPVITLWLLFKVISYIPKWIKWPIKKLIWR